jgi:hypothetical protein
LLLNHEIAATQDVLCWTVFYLQLGASFFTFSAVATGGREIRCYSSPSMGMNCVLSRERRWRTVHVWQNLSSRWNQEPTKKHLGLCGESDMIPSSWHEGPEGF